MNAIAGKLFGFIGHHEPIACHTARSPECSGSPWKYCASMLERKKTIRSKI